MVQLNKEEVDEIINALSNNKDKKVNAIIKKMGSKQPRPSYVYGLPNIRKLVRKAFKEKRKVKINYYSLSSDQVTARVVNIYQLHDDCIVAYCNLRKEERTFVIRRINAAALLEEKYKIPKNWSPKSIIFNN